MCSNFTLSAMPPAPQRLASQQLDEERVGVEEASLGQSDAPLLLDEQAILHPRVDEPALPPVAERDPLLDPGLRNAVARPEAQDEPFGQSLSRREGLVAPHREALVFAERAVPVDRLHVDVAHVAEE